MSESSHRPEPEQTPAGNTDAGTTANEPDAPPPLLTINKIPTAAPWDWLRRGWQDMVATQFRGVFYGVTFVLMGYAIIWVYANKWQLTMGLIGSFFLMGPLVCIGIYDLSRQHERGERVSLLKSMTCWRRSLASTAFFTVILTFAMLVWARVSLVLFALSSNTVFPTLKGVLSMIFSFENMQFLLIWMAVGFVFASFVFAVGVITMPMILDRDTDVFQAVFASVRSLLSNPKPLYLWAMVIVVSIGASLMLGLLPLLITAPLIGHATWHAYRDLVAR